MLVQATAKLLHSQEAPVSILDGEEWQVGDCSELDFLPTGREKNRRCSAEMTKQLNRNGISAIVALVSPALSGRSMTRQRVASARPGKVFSSTPLSVCPSRDLKGLYGKALRQPDFALTVLNAPNELPAFPELSIECGTVPIDLTVDCCRRTKNGAKE